MAIEQTRITAEQAKKATHPPATIGRIIRYRVTPEEFKDSVGFLPGGDSIIVWPAVIVGVHSNECVNLKVFSDGGNDLHLMSRVLGEEVGQWFWPPRG